jgi:hypothetical protein
MKKRPLSWTRIHKMYDKLREKYYLDAHPPLKIPPKAADLRWLWTAENSGAWAMTSFDEEGDPHTVEIHPTMQLSPNTLELVLLHELSHMRNPKATCGKKGKWWRDESKRLAALGAVRI